MLVPRDKTAAAAATLPVVSFPCAAVITKVTAYFDDAKPWDVDGSDFVKGLLDVFTFKPVAVEEGDDDAVAGGGGGAGGADESQASILTEPDPKRTLTFFCVAWGPAAAYVTGPGGPPGVVGGALRGLL